VGAVLAGFTAYQGRLLEVFLQQLTFLTPTSG
jgi:hypothetical protein